VKASGLRSGPVTGCIEAPRRSLHRKCPDAVLALFVAVGDDDWGRSGDHCDRALDGFVERGLGKESAGVGLAVGPPSPGSQEDGFVIADDVGARLSSP